MSNSDYHLHLEQERIQYDERYANSDVHLPLQFNIDPRERSLWDRHVGSLDGKQVLEVGSGDGRMACWLASLGALVLAVELSSVGITKTQERAKFYHVEDRVRVICVDACRLKTVIPANSVDLGLGFSVLHHLPPSEFGESLRTVLKPGGHAVFFENSNANPLYQFARRIRNNETTCGSPLTTEEATAFVNVVGGGELIYPRFGFFGLTKKYIFQYNKLYSSLVESLDNAIDRIPGTRRWSAHMWVVARKPE